MAKTLRERQEAYESNYDFTILEQLPVVIKITIKNYKKLIQKLPEPFSVGFSEVLSQTMLYLIQDIQDAIFGYCYNDTIIFILRNDLSDDPPWMNNEIQKMSSTVASTATLAFIKSLEMFGDELDTVGDAIFNVNTFGLPKIIESYNYLVMHQYTCASHAINSAALIELEDKLGKKMAQNLLKDKSLDEKISLVIKYCGKDIKEDYSINFLSGTGMYKIPVLRDGNIRNRWYLDKELPNFIDDRDFVLNILNTGSDIYRKSDIN